MSNEELKDLKRFITATISKSSAELRIELRANVRDDINEAFQLLDAKIDQVHDKLDSKIDYVHDKLDTKIDTLASLVFESIDAHHQDHQVRITKLEKRTA